MGVSPRVPQARATPPAEGRGCPEDQPVWGLRPSPSVLPRLSWGGSPGLPRSRPPPGALPLPFRAQVHLGVACADLAG